MAYGLIGSLSRTARNAAASKRRELPADMPVEEELIPPPMPTSMASGMQRMGGGLIGGGAPRVPTQPMAQMQAPAPVMQGGQTRTREQAKQAGLIGSSAPKGLWDEIGSDPFTFFLSGTDGLDRKYGRAADMAAAEKAAAEKAQYEQMLAKLPADQQMLWRANPEEMAKQMATNYAAANVAGGETRYLPGTNKTFSAPKFGFEGSTPFAQTFGDGRLTTTFGNDRPQSYAETTAAGIAEETGRHNLATEGIARDRLAHDKTKPTAAGGLTPYQGLNFQFKLDDLDRDLTASDEKARTSLATLDSSIALLDKFTGDSNVFAATYGNMINPTGKKDDLFNWSISMDNNRKDGMAMLNQLGGQAFIDSIREMKSAGGAGSLSDAEGSKLAVAATRLMEVNQTDDAAKEAADEFRLRLTTFRNALEKDMAAKKAAEVRRRQNMQAMMGSVANSPAPAAPSAADLGDDELRAMLGL